MYEHVHSNIFSCAQLKRMNPAPLEVCFHPNFFDLKYDTSFCPIERNALKDFYDSSKGGEWTVSTYWVDPYISHCQWYGIKCKEDTIEHITVSIELPTNGLSGTLSKSISSLSMLEVLDLSDNDIKVSVRVQIRYVYLCLSFAILTYHNSHISREPFHQT